MGDFFGGILFIFLGLVALGVVVLYFRNIYRLYLDIQAQNYTPMTLLRCVGIPIFFIGVILGFV